MEKSRREATSRADQFVVVEVASNEPEAELLCSLLRSADMDCFPRLTNSGAGAATATGPGRPRRC
jgi:hypothetical protein